MQAKIFGTFNCVQLRDETRRSFDASMCGKQRFSSTKKTRNFFDFLSSRDHFAGVFRAVSTLRVNVIAKILFSSRTRMKIRTFRVKIAFPWKFVVAVEWIRRDEVDGWLPRRVAQAFAAAAGREDEIDRAHPAAAYQTGRPRPRTENRLPFMSVGWKSWMEDENKSFPFCE